MNICMPAYTFYESDTRVIRYAETLVKRGDTVDVLALKRAGQTDFDVINGVNLYRIQERERNEKTKMSYLVRLMRFFFSSAAFMARWHMRKRYDLVHVHSVPDFEVFAAIIPKLFGAKVILDIHDIVPEFYASKFGAGRDSLAFKALMLAEKASTAFSDHVIIANHIWEKTLTDRAVKQERCTTVMNYPDLEVFHGGPRRPGNGKFVMMYPGSLNTHQGVDVAIRAFDLIKDEAPDAEFHIYGEGSAKDSLKELVASLRIGDRVHIHDFLPMDEIADAMRNADLGVEPKRGESFGNEAFSMKILEFMAVGVPVVATGTRIHRYYFDDSHVKFFESGNARELADCMLLMIRDKGLRERLVENGSRYVEKHNWGVKQAEYLALVDRLAGS